MFLQTTNTTRTACLLFVLMSVSVGFRSQDTMWLAKQKFMRFHLRIGTINYLKNLTFHLPISSVSEKNIIDLK